eukprot:6754038-Pyramimonas_sp.AAC.1
MREGPLLENFGHACGSAIGPCDAIGRVRRQVAEKEAQLSTAQGMWEKRMDQCRVDGAAHERAAEQSAALSKHVDELQEMIRGYEGQCADLRRQLAEAESQLAAREARWAQAEVILRRTKEVSWTHRAIVWMLRATGR